MDFREPLKEREAFLKRLLDTPGPSGFEAAPARVWRDEVRTLADEVTADVNGNSVATLNAGGAPRLMLAGHIDEIGIQLTHIDDDGDFAKSGVLTRRQRGNRRDQLRGKVVDTEVAEIFERPDCVCLTGA